MLEEAGLIEQRDGRLELTAKGMRRIGQRALGDLFKRLLQDRSGRHEIERERLRPRARLRAQALRVRRPVPARRRPTVRNGCSATPMASSARGSGTPVRLSPDDFEVERTELVTRVARPC